MIIDLGDFLEVHEFYTGCTIFMHNLTEETQRTQRKTIVILGRLTSLAGEESQLAHS